MQESKEDIQPKRVSVHGGHSGQFCQHAQDSLEAIVQEYIAQDFAWVGLTEHVPPACDELRYLDEVEAGLTASALYDRFSQYIEEARRLKGKYKDQLPILVGMEIETCRGCLEFANTLREEFQPDYIVGSVHFVDGICFDYSPDEYNRTAERVGSIDQLYLRYFDLQYQMIEELRPEVVGHFDLIRLFDHDYQRRLEKPEIKKRISRNLELIKKYDLILDFNLRSLLKGAEEPYISHSILKLASNMEIRLAPGDDSHSVDSVGCFMNEGIRILQECGFPCDWPVPRNSFPFF